MAVISSGHPPNLQNPSIRTRKAKPTHFPATISHGFLPKKAAAAANTPPFPLCCSNNLNSSSSQAAAAEESLFGDTRAGDVLQVIDVDAGVLNNVITFPPSGVFFVRSNIEIVSPQRVDFRFTSAVLRGENWEFPLPPFGRGWFESLYIDDNIRVVKDVRGDYLIVDRAPYKWKE